MTFVGCFDLLVLLFSFLFAYFIRSFITSFPVVHPIQFYMPFMIMSAVLFTFSSSLFQLYKKDRVIFSLSYLVDFLKALFTWGALVIAFSYFTKTDYSRVVVMLYFILSAFFVTLARLAALWGAPPRKPNLGDPEIVSAVEEIIRLSQISPDSLSILEGLNSRKAHSPFYFVVKRFLDITLSLAGLLLLLPILPYIAYLIKKDSRGKVIIAQKRIGLNGKHFTLYKFRTMMQNTPLYALAPRGGTDSRVTRVGAILRKYSIDELPQLWNVLKGEMSIVGPRPEMPFIVAKYEPWQQMRLEVKPGITGLWQILGRKDLPLDENLEYDLYYVFYQSLFLDIAIMIKTIPHLFFSRGAY